MLVTNNIIDNNVAGWDGAGVSLQDALSVDFINNTVASNDTTASAGVLFNTLGAPDASAPGAGNQTSSSTTSAPQPAGLVTMPNSSNLTMSLGNTKVTCPLRNPNCTTISNPYLANDVFWQNRSFYIGVGSLSAAYQQNIVSLFNASFSSTPGTPAVTQPSADATTPLGTGAEISGGTGACPSGASYWDIGIRGDTGPSNHATGISLSPTYSVITDIADYSAAALHNTGSNPNVVSQYCNGARIPPENTASLGGYDVPPGISDATVPNPIFNLTPTATVDEGNNWINISWGPLTETGPVTNMTLGNYGPSSSSPVINYIPSTAATYGAAPSLDYYGTPRKTNNAVDAGAVEYVGATLAIGSVTGGPLNFGSVIDTTTSAAQTLTLHNTGNGTLTGIAIVVTAPFSQSGGTCGATLNAGAACTITIVFSPATPGAASGTATITGNVAITGSPVALSGTGVAVKKTATLTPATHAFGTATRGVGQGILCLGGGPCQAFTLSNTGNVAMTGITTTVTSTIGTNFYVIPGLTSCGATLNAGTTCNIEVQFRPPTSDGANSPQSGNLTVTNSSGFTTPLTSSLTGTAR